MRVRRKTISVIALASLFVLQSVFCGKKSDEDIILDMKALGSGTFRLTSTVIDQIAQRSAQEIVEFEICK